LIRTGKRTAGQPADHEGPMTGQAPLPGGMQYLPIRRTAPGSWAARAVSVLDLEQHRRPGSPRNHATRGAASDADVSLSQRCQCLQSQRTR
jgi:hypothetical protein